MKLKFKFAVVGITLVVMNTKASIISIVEPGSIFNGKLVTECFVYDSDAKTKTPCDKKSAPIKKSPKNVDDSRNSIDQSPTLPYLPPVKKQPIKTKPKVSHTISQPKNPNTTKFIDSSQESNETGSISPAKLRYRMMNSDFKFIARGDCQIVDEGNYMLLTGSECQLTIKYLGDTSKRLDFLTEGTIQLRKYEYTTAGQDVSAHFESNGIQKTRYNTNGSISHVNMGNLEIRLFSSDGKYFKVDLDGLNRMDNTNFFEE